MPLVILSGLPLSGKSTFANQLADFIRAKAFPDKTVEVICEEDYDSDRNTCYTSSMLEKKARGNYLSAVERKVTKDNIVIADGLNYIKGFRYQLYCIARAVSTPHCVLYCVASEALARKRNKDMHRYPPQVLEELMMRFEEPHFSARWDTPLFTVDEDGQLDMQGILDALLGTVVRPPSMATTVKIGNSSELLVELDRVTQRAVEIIISRVKQVGIPTAISFADSGSTLVIRRPVQSADLQRLRRQFIHLNRLYQADVTQIESLFVKFLENNLIT